MPDVPSLFRVITSIYAAPGDTTGWNLVLESVAQLVNAQAGVYLLIDSESQANQNPARYGYSEQDRRRYESNAMEEDTRILYTDNFELGKVYREFEYVPDRAALLQGAWNRFELETYGLLWNMAARISTHTLWADFISINRQEILGPYSDDDKAALQYLLPHMSRGAELHRLVTRLEQLYGAVLDKLLVGLVVLDTRGRVVLANTVARRTVEESGALRITSALRSRRERERQVTGALRHRPSSASSTDGIPSAARGSEQWLDFFRRCDLAFEFYFAIHCQRRCPHRADIDDGVHVGDLLQLIAESERLRGSLRILRELRAFAAARSQYLQFHRGDSLRPKTAIEKPANRGHDHDECAIHERLFGADNASDHEHIRQRERRARQQQCQRGPFAHAGTEQALHDRDFR